MQVDSRQEGEAIVVSFSGDIDLEFSGEVRTILLDAIPKTRALIVDMEKVTLIDSSGVASLLEAFQSARKKGKDYIIAATGSSVMRVFKLARLETVFVLADTVAEALERVEA